MLLLDLKSSSLKTPNIAFYINKKEKEFKTNQEPQILSNSLSANHFSHHHSIQLKTSVSFKCIINITQFHSESNKKQQASMHAKNIKKPKANNKQIKRFIIVPSKRQKPSTLGHHRRAMHSAKEKTKPRSESENQQMKMKHETKQNETKKKTNFFL